MSRVREPLAPFGPLFKVLAILWLIDLWVAGPFFDGHVAPAYVDSFPLLRDRTYGAELAIVQDGIRRIPPQKLRVALVGDSTMNAALLDEQEIPYLIRAPLRRRVTDIAVETIEAGFIGLYCRDALLWIDKLLANGTGVIVYGVTLRAFPRHPEWQWVTSLSSEMSPQEIARLVAVGGTSWLHENLSADDVVAGTVFTGWRLYAYRSRLRRLFWEGTFGRALPPDSYFAELFGPVPRPAQPHSGPPTTTRGAFEWSRENYDFGNPNWQALELIGALCKRYAPGRCVMYAGPINPLDREQLVDPAFYAAYLAMLRQVAGRYGLLWRDFTDALAVAEFRPEAYGGRRDAMHPNETGRQRLAALLAEPVAQAVRCAARRGPCLGAKE